MGERDVLRSLAAANVKHSLSGSSIHHAHEVEATIGYELGALQGLPEPVRPVAEQGL